MKRVLLMFGNEIERKSLIESAYFLKHSLGFEIVPLYIRDISRERVIAATDGLLMSGRTFINESWEEVEKEEIDDIRKMLTENNMKEELLIDVGLVSDVVKEQMKKCDILLMGKNDVLAENEVDALRANYKVVMLIGKKPLASFNKVIIGNDDGVKVNRSCYHFMSIFPNIENFHSFVLNKKLEENNLLSYLKEHGKNVTHEEIEKEEFETILDKINLSDIFIMGNLSRSYFFEKIIGKNGIKLIEKTDTPIFIG